MRLLAALLILGGAAACSNHEPTLIDGSSDAAFERSTTLARRDLPDRDRLTFDTAIRTVGGRRMANRDPGTLARVTFDGMTAAQVVADAHARGIR